MSNRLIILGPGWSKPDWAWNPIMSRCKGSGFDVLRLSYPARGFGDIRKIVHSLKDVVSAVGPEYEHVTFIGHSMGGLIGRSLIQQTEASKHIDAYVSIATPHRGTLAAYLAPWSASATQMRPGSSFLRELNSDEWPQIPTLAIRASWDLVAPDTSFVHASEEITIPMTDHISVVFRSRTFYEINAWLTFGVFGESPSDTPGYGSKITLR